MVQYLCSSKHHIGLWCCQWCCSVGRCGLLTGSLHSPGEARSPGSGHCRQTTSPGRSCPGRTSRPDKAAPLWPAGPRGTRSGLRLTTETACLGPRSETLHLEDGDMRTCQEADDVCWISSRETPGLNTVSTFVGLKITHNMSNYIGT